MNEIYKQAGAVWASLPPLLSALLLLLFGLLAAAALRFLVSKSLYVLRFDKLSDKLGVTEFLRKGKSNYTASRLAGAFVYWIVLLAAFLEVAKILDMGIYLAISEKLTHALPNLIAGVFIAIVGSLIVSFLANFVLTIALNASLSYARLLSRAIKWLGIIVVVTVSLEQAGLGRSIVEFTFQIVLGATLFGTALAFGLGCKDMAAGLFRRFLDNLREKERAAKGSDLEG